MKAISKCASLIEAVRAITKEGTSVWLFDTPPYDPTIEIYEDALQVSEAGIPLTKRTLTGVLGKKANLIEKDKGYGTYKKWDPDKTSYDIIAITKEQFCLKSITLASLTTANTHKFFKKCKAILNHNYNFKWVKEFHSNVMDETAAEEWNDLLETIRQQCHMELMSAIVDSELKEKARLLWDILQKSNGDAFGKQVNVKQDVNGNVNVSRQLDLPAIQPPDGWNLG